MKLVLLSVLLGLLAAVPAEAVKVYRTTSEGLADVKVYETSSEGLADCLIYVTSSEGLASGDAKWYFVSSEGLADVKSSSPAVKAWPTRKFISRRAKVWPNAMSTGKATRKVMPVTCPAVLTR